MKTTIKAMLFVAFFWSILFIGMIANAQSCDTAVATEAKVIKTDVPDKLKGGTLLFRDAQGHITSEMPIEQYKIVPRVQERLVTKETVTCATKAAAAEPAPKYSSRVSLLGGYGAQPGLHRNNSDSPNEVDVESKVGFVGGVMGQKMLTERLSLGLQWQTNETTSLSLGWELK